MLKFSSLVTVFLGGLTGLAGMVTWDLFGQPLLGLLLLGSGLALWMLGMAPSRKARDMVTVTFCHCACALVLGLAAFWAWSGDPGFGLACVPLAVIAYGLGRSV